MFIRFSRRECDSTHSYLRTAYSSAFCYSFVCSFNYINVPSLITQEIFVWVFSNFQMIGQLITFHQAMYFERPCDLAELYSTSGNPSVPQT